MQPPLCWRVKLFLHFSQIYLYSIAGFDVFLTDILLAWFIIIVFAYINIKGIRFSSVVQNILIVALIANMFIILTIMLFTVDLHMFTVHYIQNYRFNATQILSVLAIVPFLFVGFDVIVQVSSDIGFERRKSSSVAIIGILFGATMYSVLNLITALAFNVDALQEKNWALGEGVLSYAGFFPFMLLIVALFAAVSGGINGFMLSTSKLLGAISHYALLPKKYSIQNKERVYVHSIRFIVFVSMIAPLFGRKVIIYIVDLCSVLAALTYAYVCFIGIQLSQERSEKLSAIAGFVVSISFILLLTVPFSPTFLSIPSLLFMGMWTLLGIIYYSIYGKNTKT